MSDNPRRLGIKVNEIGRIILYDMDSKQRILGVGNISCDLPLGRNKTITVEIEVNMDSLIADREAEDAYEKWIKNIDGSYETSKRVFIDAYRIGKAAK